MTKSAAAARATRRALLRAACALGASAPALAALGVCTLGACASTDRTGTARAQPLADGVYLLQGSAGAADAANRGRIGNVGFIVGPDGVVVIDTGTSLAHGRAVLAAIAQVTERPVKLALLTHVRPEFVFGAGALHERGIPLRAHSRSARLIAARCDTCLKALRANVGDAELHGTVVVAPDQEFDAASHTLTLIGRPLSVWHYGHSSGPGDIAVFDEQSGVLFAGGLLDAGRVPDIQDGELPAWRRALAALRTLRPRLVVPGHGPAVPAERGIAAVENYLLKLEDKVRSLVDSGASLIGVGEVAELPEFARWDQYDAIHRRNASIAYLRFERELLFKPEPVK